MSLSVRSSDGSSSPSHAPVTTDLTSEFPLDPDLIYLNHAAVGPWPRRTVEAIEAFARENLHRSIRNYRIWTDLEDRVRERLARLLGGGSGTQVALLKNTSEAISTVAFGFDWQAGDNVVLPDCEFPANRAPWRRLVERGVEVREVEVGLDPQPDQRLLAACDQRTRLVATSWVHYTSGIRTDLERLAGACRERGIAVLVDAIQGLGALPFEADRWGVDFVAGGAHKWLLSPEGVGYLWCRPEWLPRIRPLSWGWRMAEKPFQFEAEQGLSPSARRFECGTLNTLGLVGLDATLGLLEDLGIGPVADAVLNRSGHLIEGLRKIPGVEIATPAAPTGRAGIVAFRTADTRERYRALRHAGVLPALRDGWLRLAPHFHTPMDQLDRVLGLLAESPT